MAGSQLALEIRAATDGPDGPSRWRIEPGCVAEGFRENVEYRFRKPAGGHRLLIDDEAVGNDDGDWVWRPGFYAGQVHAELLGPDGSLRAVYRLDVSPDPGKLGRDVFQPMLREIWEFDPLLMLGVEPAGLRVGRDARMTDPWLEYVRLRTYGEAFVRALRTIARRPIRELRARRAELLLQHVRRVDPQTVIAALLDPRLLPLFSCRSAAVPPVDALPPFDVDVARDTLDGAANRCIAAVAHMASRRAIRLKQTLQAIVERESESDTRTSLAPRWDSRRDFLDRIVQEVRQAESSSPLSDATRREISAAALTAVSSDPSYSSAYGLGWRILRPVVEGRPDQDRVWLSPTWEIYERWCFVQIGRIVKQALGPGWDWRVTRDHRSYATAALTGSRYGKVCVELLLQPTFPAGDPPSTGFKSISRMRKPDIVLTRIDEDPRRWYVLDAKYRTARSKVLDAMSSAHIYRDSLRWKERPSDLSLLCVPRGGGAEWMASAFALSAPMWILDGRSGCCSDVTRESDGECFSSVLRAG